MKTRRSRDLILALALLGLLWLAGNATGSFDLPRYHDSVQDLRGNAISGAKVYVYHANTTTLATLYNTSNIGGATKTNPLTTDTYGRFWFYAPAGTYDLTVTRAGLTTYTLEDVSLVVGWPDTLTFAGSIAYLDTLAAATTGAGVQVDGVLVNGKTAYADTIRGKSAASVYLGASGVNVTSKTIKADTVTSVSGAGVVLGSGHLAVGGQIKADSLVAKSAAGVIVGKSLVRSKTIQADTLRGRTGPGVYLSTGTKAKVGTIQADSLTGLNLAPFGIMFVNGLQFHRGAIIRKVSLKSVSDTLTVDDDVFVYYGQIGNTYVTLPVMSGGGAVAAPGRAFTVANCDPTLTDTVFVEANGAELLNGSALRKAYALIGGGYRAATFIFPHQSIGWITVSATN